MRIVATAVMARRDGKTAAPVTTMVEVEPLLRRYAERVLGKPKRPVVLPPRLPVAPVGPRGRARP